MAPDDAELIRRTQQGELDAFEQLVFKHDKKVLGIAARFVTSSEDAKDIYQEVFYRAYRGLKNFHFQSEFATWLHRITINVCLNHRARQKQRMLVSQGDGDEESHGSGEFVDPDERPDQILLNSDLNSRVEEALRTLSPRQRMVFTLKHYDGYKLGEIATMMHCTEGTVKRYLFTATQRMRDQLKDML